MYIGLVHCRWKRFLYSQIDRVLFAHSAPQSVRIDGLFCVATTAAFLPSFAGGRRQCIMSEAVVGIQPRHSTTAVQTPRRLEASACPYGLAFRVRHAILPSPCPA